MKLFPTHSLVFKYSADSLEEVVGLDAAYSQGVLQTRARAQSEEENMEHYISEYVKQREEKAFIKKINSNSTHGRTILGASMHSMNIINSSMHSRKDSLPRAIESLNNSRHSGSRGSSNKIDSSLDTSRNRGIVLTNVASGNISPLPMTTLGRAQSDPSSTLQYLSTLDEKIL